MQILSIEHPYLGQLTRSFVLKTEAGPVLVDTGLQSGISRIQEAAGAAPVAVLCTHGHWDHMGGHAWFQKQGAKIYAARGDSHIMGDLALQWQMLYEQFHDDFSIPEARRQIYSEAGDAVKADVLLSQGQNVCFGTEKMEIYETPGHSDGSICIYAPDTGVLFTGDTVCGDGFNGTLPQVNDFKRYLDTLGFLGRFDVETAHTAHLKTALDDRGYHAKLEEGLACCQRLLEQAESFVRTAPAGFTIGDLAGRLCESEGGKPLNSGACVTAGALLRYLREEEKREFACSSQYIL